MKIVQTLWLPDIENSISYKGGWPSPEYHWMSWALSCLLLYEQYPEIDLYTTDAGRDVLIEKLDLPYTSVHILPENRLISTDNWALAKLLTYQQQTSPFLHVDGDVFIWKPFSQALLGSELIVQNIETDRTVYEGALQRVFSPMQSVADKFNTSLIPPKTSDIMACNAGILGGNDLDFIQAYTQLAINIAQTVSKPEEMNTSTYCMLFEQYVFARLTQKYCKSVNTFFDEPVADIRYTEFENFWRMKKIGYYHLMGQFKHNQLNLNLLTAEIRQRYPTTYYKILNAVKAASIQLDNKVYGLSEFNPCTHTITYLTTLKQHYLPNYVLAEPVNWLHYYAKSVIVHQQLNAWLNLPSDLMDRQLLVITTDFWLFEQTEPELQQQIKFPDPYTLDFVSIDLGSIGIIMLDSLLENEKTINQLIEVVTPYFSEDDITNFPDLLREVVRRQVWQFIVWGIVRQPD